MATESCAAPGAMAAKAETFAIVERLRATGLALDFISPELYAAARTYGFNGADAKYQLTSDEYYLLILNADDGGQFYFRENAPGGNY